MIDLIRQKRQDNIRVGASCRQNSYAAPDVQRCKCNRNRKGGEQATEIGRLFSLYYINVHIYMLKYEG